MKARCYNPKRYQYADYGGRGVIVCETWKKDYSAFREWAINNGWEHGLQLDKDTKGDGMIYSPETCMFVTPKVNSNARRNNKIIKYNGIEKTASEWADEIGCSLGSLYNRLRRGWSFERCYKMKKMAEVLIQGVLCHYRDLRQTIITEDGELIDGEDVLYAGVPKDQQVFTRTEVPFSDDDLVSIAAKELTYQGYTPIQKQWVDRENKRFEEGVYAYIDGELTYIPGAYYCYVNYWTLEHGEKPEYREDDREFFLFHEYLRNETDCLGVTRLKGRRQGATSIAMFFMWFIAGRKEHKNCGTTSFNDGACQDNFQRMFMYGFKAMLPCFQADFDSDSENFIRFVKPVEKKRKGVLAVKREGLNSYCDYKSNAINSYDSGRQSYNVPDEAAKRGVKVNINSYWSRLNKTLVIGINKVGFAYLPTTVGAKKEGGEAYKTFFNDSNQYKVDDATGQPYGVNTPTKCVQYFMPATRCYAGCIDKFGRSVIEDPVEPVMGNDGRWIKEGSKTKILRERAKLKDEQLLEDRRDYPIDIYDAFSFEAGTCEFDEERIKAQIEWLEKEENKAEAFWRQGRLYDDYDEKGRLIAKYADDPKGSWFVKKFPDIPNNYVTVGEQIYVKNTASISLGADTYKNVFAAKGSDGTICVFEKSNVVNGIEMGLRPIAFYVGRPKLIEQFNFQAFLGCIFWGGKINYEIDAGTWFYENFKQFNAIKLLEWEPARDPTKNNKTIKPGTESASPFQLAKQLEVAKLYFDGNGIDHYNGNIENVTFIPLLKQGLEYNHEDRLRFDLMICFMMALLPILATPPARKRQKAQTEAAPKKPLLPTFRLKMHQ